VFSLIDLLQRKDGPPVVEEMATGLHRNEHADERRLAMAHETQPAQYLPRPNQSRDFSSPGLDAGDSRTYHGQVTRISNQGEGASGGSAVAGTAHAPVAKALAAARQPHPSDGSPAGDSGPVAPLRIPEINRGLQLNQRPGEVVRIAIEVFAKTSSWVEFYRAILGPEGVARKLFKGADQNRFWETTPEFFQIQEMLTAIRSHDELKSDSVEPLRMITIRLPLSMHEALKQESKERTTSINKLCLSKLLNGIDQKLIPQEKGQIRGRKPGPQGKRSTAKVD